MTLKEMKNSRRSVPTIAVDDQGTMVCPRGILFYQSTKGIFSNYNWFHIYIVSLQIKTLYPHGVK